MEGGREVERQTYRQDCDRLPPHTRFLPYPALLAAAAAAAAAAAKALSVLQHPCVQDVGSLPRVLRLSRSGRLQEGPCLALPLAPGGAGMGIAPPSSGPLVQADPIREVKFHSG